MSFKLALIWNFFSKRFDYRLVKGSNAGEKLKVIGLTRVRNEALIIDDSLNHMAKYVDAIIIFDDASTDDTLVKALEHPKVLEIIVNKRWRRNRTFEETLNRKILHEHAKKYNPMWIVYCDADERLEGGIRPYLLSKKSDKIDGIRVSLFDAYMTARDKTAYTRGQLYNFRKFFGPEKRDILMIWRNSKRIKFDKPDAREPSGLENGTVITKFYCQHYGKALSIKHWEETCDYYVRHFPQYAEKWKERKGKAIHTHSDFGTPLYKWKDVKKRSIKIHPI